MIIELVFNNLNQVVWLRKNRWKSPKNKPIEDNIRAINDSDFDELVRFMSHLWIEECIEDKAHFKSWDLYLKALDYRSKQAIDSPNYRKALQVSKY